MLCRCGKPVEPGRDECFRCRVSTVGFAFQGGALNGHSGFHRTKGEWLREHLGTDNERELARRTDIERVTGDESWYEGDVYSESDIV